jgi:hypothetical protein
MGLFCERKNEFFPIIWYINCSTRRKPDAFMKKQADTPKASKAKPSTPTTPKVRTRKKKAIVDFARPDPEEIATAAFLNWCHRRNQGLPDDPVADWITAENAMGLAN